jgi:hypothetical protein
MNKKGIVLIIFIVMTSIINSLSAQDSVRTQNAPNSDFLYEGDDFQKYQLSLSSFWRGYLSDGFGKWGAGLNYKLKDGTSSNMYTIGFAGNLTFNVNQNIGIVSGLEIASYSGKASGNFEDSYLAVDAAGYDFTFKYILKDYSEQQKLTLLSVPLMVKFSTNSFSDVHVKYFAACGFKIGIPVSGGATVRPESLTTTAHFHEENIVYRDFPEQGLVSNFHAPKQQSKIDFRMGVALALETGLTFMSNENINAGASVYCDIGLNSLLKSDNRHMVEYQRLNPGQLRFNSIMKTGKVNSVELFSLGLKLSVNFNLNKKDK